MDILIYEVVVGLERELVDCYRLIKHRTRDRVLRKLFRFMEKQCLAHAAQAEYLPRDITLPGNINLQAVGNVQAAVKEQLRSGTRGEANISTVLMQLAHGEKIIGDLYREIAATIQQHDPSQQRTIGIFLRLAEEEAEHAREIVAVDQQWQEKLAAKAETPNKPGARRR